jgi:hypothetical protein
VDSADLAEECPVEAELLGDGRIIFFEAHTKIPREVFLEKN